MKNCKKLFIGIVLLAFCFGCAAQSQCTKAQQACAPVAKSESCIQKADNVLVIFDSSETMARKYKGVQKLKIAKGIVASMDQSIPAITLNSGLRDFGRGYTLFSINQSTLLQGMAPYQKGEMTLALKQVSFAAGNTPMSKALNLAAEDLRGVSGRTAVIVVSDGKVTDKGTIAAAENMKKIYGDKVCIYTIQIGDCYPSEKLLEEIARIGGCGFSINAAELATCDAMAQYVKKVLFEQEQASAKMIINSVLFDFDSNVVKPEAGIVLEQVAIMLKQDSRDVVVEGHTCSLGSEEYNMGLSERRANAVRGFLVDQGVEASRLIASGVGEAEPVADNTTKNGREQNRRVEFEVK